MRTGFHTSKAMDTPVFAEDELRHGGLAFGIVAPPAIKRASFEKYGGANAWAIVSGIPCYVENQSRI
jgi:hypothetical protein